MMLSGFISKFLSSTTYKPYIKHLSDIFLFNSQKLSSQLVLLTNFTGKGIAA